MTTPSLILDRFTNLQPIDSKHGSIEIYRALHIHRYADVLLKVASRAPGDSIADLIEAQNRICVEALVTQLVNHPHVVRVIDASTGPALNTFVALEFLDGQDLASHLELAAPLSVTHALELAITIGKAVEAAHRAGVIHGDIKPSNIMLVHGAPTLVDFGCAFSPLVAPYRPLGQPTGTFGYMCPRYRATATLTERSDIFSFGVLLYEMLTGINPFAEEARSHISETFVVQSNEARRRKRSRKVPLLTEIAPQVPPELAREVHRAIARNPDRRHSSMSELLAALESNQRRLSHFQPITLERTGDDYATAGCGIPALARALDILAEEHSPPTCSGLGTGFGRGFFAGGVHPKALKLDRPLPALIAHKPASSLQAVFTGTADASPLLKVKARDEAVTVPGVDPNGLAVCAATFATLPTGTMVRGPSPLRAHARSVAVTGSDTWPLGTLIVCSRRTRITTPCQAAVAHKLEPETTIAPPAPIPESAKLAVSAAVGIAPARAVPSEAPSTPAARKPVLVSGPSSKPWAPSSKANARNAFVAQVDMPVVVRGTRSPRTVADTVSTRERRDVVVVRSGRLASLPIVGSVGRLYAVASLAAGAFFVATLSSALRSHVPPPSAAAKTAVMLPQLGDGPTALDEAVRSDVRAEASSNRFGTASLPSEPPGAEAMPAPRGNDTPAPDVHPVIRPRASPQVRPASRPPARRTPQFATIRWSDEIIDPWNQPPNPARAASQVPPRPSAKAVIPGKKPSSPTR